MGRSDTLWHQLGPNWSIMTFMSITFKSLHLKWNVSERVTLSQEGQNLSQHVTVVKICHNLSLQCQSTTILLFNSVVKSGHFGFNNFWCDKGYTNMWTKTTLYIFCGFIESKAISFFFIRLFLLVWVLINSRIFLTQLLCFVHLWNN